MGVAKGTISVRCDFQCRNLPDDPHSPARTDFVGTNPQFTNFAGDLAAVVVESNPADVEGSRLLNLADRDELARTITDKIPLTSARTCAFFVSSVLRLTDGALASYPPWWQAC